MITSLNIDLEKNLKNHIQYEIIYKVIKYKKKYFFLIKRYVNLNNLDKII